MYYKEFLRVRHALYVLSIVLASFVLIQVVANLAVYGVLVANYGKAAYHDLSAFFAASGVVASIFAGILAVSLGSENCGHLEQAWTKPVSRVRYGLTLFAVDLAGVFAAFVLSLVAHMFIHYLEGTLGSATFDKYAWESLIIFLLLPVAWYGLVVALTASLRESSKTVAGLTWVVALILVALGYATLPAVWGLLVKTINYVNPIAYAYWSAAQQPYPFHAWEANAAGLLGITIFGAGAALAQWRRLEA